MPTNHMRVYRIKKRFERNSNDIFILFFRENNNDIGSTPSNKKYIGNIKS